MSLLFEPKASYHRPWSGKIILIAPNEIPTIDFYINARLRPEQRIDRYYGDVADFSGFSQSGLTGAFVIIVRHASAEALKLLRQYQNLWSGVAFLMDDDIPGAWLCQDIPRDYAFWTSARYFAVKTRLAGLCDRIWVSTPALQTRYATVKTSILPPRPFEQQRPSASPECNRWAYHGTRVHGQELAWLPPIVAAVHEAVPTAEFEVFGNARVARLFRQIPRVRLLATRSWRDYLAHCHSTELAVGLAPMLPGKYNAVRSYAKAFDITRCGAVGIFSDSDAYAPLSEAATLLPNEPKRWIDEVIGLLQDAPSRSDRFAKFSAWLQSSPSIDLESMIRQKPK